MSDNSKIEWTDATWNPITGCSVVSAGCTNCYAMRLAGTRLKNHPSRAGLTRETAHGPVWTGEVRLNREWLDQPLRWRRRRRIFVCAHGDLFHDQVPREWIDLVVAVIAMSPQHQFQVLTKRPDRMAEYFWRIMETDYGLEALDKSSMTIVAWGSWGDDPLVAPRVGDVMSTTHYNRIQTWALGFTQSGQPRHPLYVRSDAKLKPWPVWDLEAQ